MLIMCPNCVPLSAETLGNNHRAGPCASVEHASWMDSWFRLATMGTAFLRHWPYSRPFSSATEKQGKLLSNQDDCNHQDLLMTVTTQFPPP